MRTCSPYKRGNTKSLFGPFVLYVFNLAVSAAIILMLTTSSIGAIEFRDVGISKPVVGEDVDKLTNMDVAEYYFPQHIWFHPLESCSWPAEPGHPGIAVYRVREHPEDPSLIAVTYAILYKNDCGGTLGIDSHPGDVEGFSYTLAPDENCPVGWRLSAVKTTAHGGEPRDIETDFVDSCEPLPELFVSSKKHGTYLTMERCNHYPDPTQRCERGFTTDFILINAGDPDAPLADGLSAYFPGDPCYPYPPIEYIWSGDGNFCGGQCVKNRDEACVAAPGFKLTDDSMLAPTQKMVILLGIGDSMTHGTMDATNNSINTLNAYFERVASSLGNEINLYYKQPLFDIDENRIYPFTVPTNLGVDGSDSFSLEGLEYYKRVGADESYISPELLCDSWLPSSLEDKYDKVLYPINLLAKKPVSQLDSALWHLKESALREEIEKELIILWIGNNDSSLAALGAGGENPEYLPFPYYNVASELSPALRMLLRFAEKKGLVSFAPFTQGAIERNLTDLQDFKNQYERILSRLENESTLPNERIDLFILTLPYYSAVGYLMDSDDIEFYLKKINPSYTVPPSFKRVAPPGEPITDPLRGDRISLLTFGMMYSLLSTGHSINDVNTVLEVDGRQNDGLVLSEAEQQYIMSRIDGFNDAIKSSTAMHGTNFHLVDIGEYLNQALTGEIDVIINGRKLSRKWIRGSAFSFDGVHPDYTGQALIANFILQKINENLGINAEPYDLSAIMAGDPYVDNDGDGWAPGPDYQASGINELLFLFKDPDDSNSDVQVVLPPDVWELISDIILGLILDIPEIRAEAIRLGINPAKY